MLIVLCITNGSFLLVLALAGCCTIRFYKAGMVHPSCYSIPFSLLISVGSIIRSVIYLTCNCVSEEFTLLNVAQQ